MEKEKRNKKAFGIIGGFVIIILLITGYISFSTLLGGKAGTMQRETAKASTHETFEGLTPFTDEGEFIAYFHVFYNETACYGGLHSLNWEKQAAAASAVVHSLENLKPDNEDLAEDFKKMAKLAKKIENAEKKKAHVKKLHRYFHDLDIHYNGYKESAEVFHITKFK